MHFNRDLQHNPSEIPRLIGAMVESGADVVVGSRFKEGARDIPRYRALGNVVLNRLTSSNVEDSQSGFRAYSRRAVEGITPAEKGMGVDSEILMKAIEKGMKVVEVQIGARYDVPKPSKSNFLVHALNVVASVMKHHSINHPLMFYGIPAVASLIVAVAFGAMLLETYARTKQFIIPYLIVSGFSFIAALVLGATALILFVVVSVVREK